MLVQLSAKEARRAERRRAEEERLAAKEAKRAAWLAAQAAREAGGDGGGDGDYDDGDAENGGDDAPAQPPHSNGGAAAAGAAAAEPGAAAAGGAATAAAQPPPAEPVRIPNKIFVGGLPFNKTADEIRDFFAGASDRLAACLSLRSAAWVSEAHAVVLRAVHGEVAEVDCLTFPDSGRFRGIAMVRFADEAGATRHAPALGPWDNAQHSLTRHSLTQASTRRWR